MKEFYVAKNSLLMGAAMGPGKDFSFRGFPCGQAEEMGTLTVTVSAPWTPAEITTAQWLDADDSATITLNGTTVSKWEDKSGNGRHVEQTTAGSQPAYSTGLLNSKNMVVFSNDWMGVTTGGVENECVHHVFYVSHNPTSSNTGCGATTSGTCLYNKNYGAISHADQGHKGEAICSGTIAAHVHRSNHIHNILYFGKTMSGGNIVHFDWQTRTPYLNVNGILLSTGIAAPQTAHFNYGIGLSHYGAYYGGIGEKIVILGALSVNDRQKLEGYLAHKWNLAASLHSDHPYKSAAPTL